ncbi:MAG: competence protein ComEA [Pseudonocardiales bacterium]|nr:competence protein ComEA [Pseudonocardiales bacterium]
MLGAPGRAEPEAADVDGADDLDGPDTLPLPIARPASARAPSASPASASTAGGRRLIGRLVPESWRAVRLDPGRPGAIALVVVAVVAAVVAAVGVWTGRPQAEPVRGLPGVVVGGPEPSAAPPSPVSSTSPAPSHTLVVSVSGRVARPGLVQVPDGSRVADVVAAAGGALPGVDLTALNLARRVNDGEQVAVGVPTAPDAAGAESSAPGGGVAAGGGPAARVDLNTATVAQLDALPGVGPVTAQHIVDWRTRNGRFAKIEQLREVDGIGEHRFQQLHDLVTV